MRLQKQSRAVDATSRASRPAQYPSSRDETAAAVMILGPVSYLDCLIFCILLAPQLVWHVGLFAMARCVAQALPFLRKLNLIHVDRYLTSGLSRD